MSSMPSSAHRPAQPFAAPADPRPLRRACARSAVAALALACCSCNLFNTSSGMSREQALNAPSTGFARDGVDILVQAAPGLNPADGHPHTVVVGVLQAEQADALQGLAARPDRLQAALAEGATPAGVLLLSRFVVQPGQTCRQRLDRVQGARAVALAVGYAQREPAPPLRVWDIPLELESKGWVLRSYTARTGPLHLQLVLGADDIVQAGPLPDSAQGAKSPVAPCLPLAPV